MLSFQFSHASVSCGTAFGIRSCLDFRVEFNFYLSFFWHLRKGILLVQFSQALSNVYVGWAYSIVYFILSQLTQRLRGVSFFSWPGEQRCSVSLSCSRSANLYFIPWFSPQHSCFPNSHTWASRFHFSYALLGRSTLIWIRPSQSLVLFLLILVIQGLLSISRLPLVLSFFRSGNPDLIPLKQ